MAAAMETIMTRHLVQHLKGLKDITAQEEVPHIVVMATGGVKILFYKETWEELKSGLINKVVAKAHHQSFQNPLLKELVETYSDKKASKLQQFQATVDYMNQIFDNSPRVKALLKDYYQTVDGLIQRGCNIVVAAGNEANSFPRGLKLPEDALVNWYGIHPGVILVGGSVTNGTPSDFSGDRMYSDSSPGTTATSTFPKKIVPTTLAPSHYLFAERGSSKLSRVWGTSYGAPWVAGTIALMLEAKPELKPHQIKKILTAASEKSKYIKDLPEVLTGNGFLDPLKALELAKNSI